MIFYFPIRTVNGLNSREHWAARAKRAKRERGEVCLFVKQWKVPLPCAVTLTRLSTAQMDGDGLQAALKHVRDGVADALGLDDADPRVIWAYQQEKAKRGNHGVRINLDAPP